MQDENRYTTHKLKDRLPVPCPINEWPSPDERRVAKTVEGDVEVSTVFLTIDHGFGGSPLWFETMVFGGPFDGECDRYETYEQAESGHELMCEKIGIKTILDAQIIA